MKKLISRRNFLKVCALAGSAAALSACGGGKSNGGNNSAAAAVDDGRDAATCGFGTCFSQ